MLTSKQAATRLNLSIKRIPQLVRELGLKPKRAWDGKLAPYLFTERELKLMEGRNRKPGRKGEKR